MKLHLIQLFHTRATPAFSHCAFTTRAIDLCNMMVDSGHEVIEYGNPGSTSRASRHIELVTDDEYAANFPPLTATGMHGDNASLDTPSWAMFDKRLRAALRSEVQPGDVVLHPFGRAHAGIPRSFPDQIHVEPFVGYPDAPMGAFRIYESEAWRHYHLGRYETMRDPHNGQPMYANEIGIARNYSFVIQNARDAAEWPIGEGRGDYVLYMGRIIDVKGCLRIAEMIRRWDKLHPDDGLRFVFAGQGDFDRVASATIKGDERMVRRLGYEGHVTGKARASLVGNAIAMLCPTQYVEPGGGSAIEAQMCGTPVLASAWGCFTESVLHGITGYQCRTWGDWMAALEWAPKLSRRTIAQVARERFSFEAAAPQYVKVLKTLELLFKNDEVTSLVIP